MPSTSFLEEEDKELVQTARQYVDQGVRIAWKDVATKMTRWGRSPKELAQRMNSLKRTFGSDLSKFPRCFYTPVRASRGRRSSQILLTRQSRGGIGLTKVQAQESSQRTSGIVFTRELIRSPFRSKEMEFVPSTLEVTIPFTKAHKSLLVTPGAGQTSGAHALSPMGVNSKCMLRVPGPIATAAAKADVLPTQRNVVPAISSLIQEDKVPRDVHQAVAAMFEKITRSEVAYPPGAIYLNAGEILPSGVSTLIASIRQIDTVGTRDVFLDIGSGVGNVVAQFVLSTTVRKSIGIEIRRDLVDRCNGILDEYVAIWSRLQDVEVYAEDVEQIGLSIISPFSEATIVFTNNLRFEPSVSNHITDELSHMPDVWVAAFTSVVCPRHSSICRKQFCSRWKLQTCIRVNVSWTSSAVPIYIYTDKEE